MIRVALRPQKRPRQSAIYKRSTKPSRRDSRKNFLSTPEASEFNPSVNWCRLFPNEKKEWTVVAPCRSLQHQSKRTWLRNNAHFGSNSPSRLLWIARKGLSFGTKTTKALEPGTETSGQSSATLEQVRSCRFKADQLLTDRGSPRAIDTPKTWSKTQRSRYPYMLRVGRR